LLLESNLIPEKSKEENEQLLLTKYKCKTSSFDDLINMQTERLFQLCRRVARCRNKFSNLEIECEQGSSRICKRKKPPRVNKVENGGQPCGLLVFKRGIETKFPKPKRIKLERTSCDMESEALDFSKENAVLKSQISTFHRSIQNFEEIVSEKETIIKGLNRDLEKKEKDLKLAEIKTMSLQESLGKLMKEMTVNNRTVPPERKIGTIKVQSSKEIDVLKSQIATFHRSIENYKETVKENSTLIESLKEDLERREKEVILAKEEKKSLEEQDLNAQAEIKHLKEDLGRLVKEVATLKKAVEELEKKNSQKVMKFKEDELAYKSALNVCLEQSVSVDKTLEDYSQFFDRFLSSHKVKKSVLEKPKRSFLQTSGFTLFNDCRECLKINQRLFETWDRIYTRLENIGDVSPKMIEISDDIIRREADLNKELSNLKEKYNEIRESAENYGNKIIEMQKELDLNEKSMKMTREVIKSREAQIMHLQRLIGKIGQDNTSINLLPKQ